MSSRRLDDSRFRARVNQIINFRHQHGRFPTRYAESDTERSLAYFLQRIRQSDRGKATDIPLTADRVEHLNSVLPGWRGRGPHHTMDENIDRLGAFVVHQGLLPRHQAEGGEERALSTFLARARAIAEGRARGTFTPAQMKRLDENAPGWRLTARERTKTSASTR
ncbi:hypothetical protein [Microbacterium xylanilyticum]